MSTIVTAQGIVHYETYGSGPPVILLHGWLGSWGTWRSTIEALGNEYRAYALDFWGFGESDKRREQFEVPDFVELVDQFMDRLGISSAPVVGHSMGGTVSLGVAIHHPERVQKVAVVGAPLEGKSFQLMLRPFANSLWARFWYSSPWLFRFFLRVLYAPLITRKQPRQFYNMTAPVVTNATLESFFRSIKSLYHTNLVPDLGKIKVPAMGVYGALDVLINPGQRFVFEQHIPDSRILYLKGSGHIPMMDQPDLFNQGLREFLKV